MTKSDGKGTKQLTAKQRRAVVLMASGMSITEVAHQIGAARPTVSGWQRLPRFRQELDRTINESSRETLSELRALAGEATQTIRGLLRDGKSEATRLGAARLLLDTLGVLRPESPINCSGGGAADIDLHSLVAAITAEENDGDLR